MQHCQQKFVEFTHSITSLAFTQQSTEERVERAPQTSKCAHALKRTRAARCNARIVCARALRATGLLSGDTRTFLYAQILPQNEKRGATENA